jgi:hypothetical protein
MSLDEATCRLVLDSLRRVTRVSMWGAAVQSSLKLLATIAYQCRGSEAMTFLLGVRVAEHEDMSKLAIA